MREKSAVMCWRKVPEKGRILAKVRGTFARWGCAAANEGNFCDGEKAQRKDSTQGRKEAKTQREENNLTQRDGETEGQRGKKSSPF